ncbi:SGNH/GDSL hydrolase family protein [Nocardia sp. NBC_01327]|uniref:SGNH/GDSL hydrolase family protein n=1 Tax=Nocardia sp. NBC_01327 TaxID=2903593 RepID=UPI002E114655|nr:SGNH/GDSL hydrolase family protein [Nocardia sp. NBC_01327]
MKAIPVVRIVAALFALLVVLAAATAAAPVSAPGWQAVWATGTQRPGDNSFVPNWSMAGFGNQSVRQVIRVSDGGTQLRLRLSNQFGTKPLQVTGATVARSAGGAAVHPDSLRQLLIGSEAAFRIPPGTTAVTDPITMPVDPLELLTVTLFFADPTGPGTYHAQVLGTSYLAWGDHRSDTAPTAFTVTSSSYYYLAAVETQQLRPRPSGVALLGDSLTEGVGSTMDAHHTYPEVLAESLVAQGKPRPILNLGIGGNCVTADSQWMGESAISRFRRDVLDQPGVGAVVVLEGINDIWLGGGNLATGGPGPGVSAEQLIAGYRSLIALARAAGIRVIGATIPPAAGSTFGDGDRVRYDDREGVRKAVNDWIRTSGEYDAVVDSAAVLADPADPERLAPAFDSGDHLHLRDAGYVALAAAVAAVLD